jgi:TatD DNase family protein
MRPQDDHRWPLLEAQAHDARIAAIGECGLDHLRHIDEETRAWAEACFVAQIALAVAAAKPLVLHCVRAHGRCIELLRQHRGDRVGGIVHAFSGSAEEAAAYRRLGFVVGLGAAVTREAAKRVRTAAATLPSGTFVLETDAPFMAAAPAPAGSGRIEDLEAVAAAVASLRNCATEELYAQTAAVALRLLAPASLPSRGNLGIAAVDPT